MGSFQTLGRVLSRGRKAGSDGVLFAGSVAIAERGEEAFKGPLCTLWERIGKRVRRGGKVKDRKRENKKGRPPGVGRRPCSASRVVMFARSGQFSMNPSQILVFCPGQFQAVLLRPGPSMRSIKKLVVNQGAHNPDIAPAD